MRFALTTYPEETVFVDVNIPQYGYELIYHMSIFSQVAADKSYSFFDPSPHGTFDYCILRLNKWLLPETQKNDLNYFLNRAEKARGQNFFLRLGENPTGFFPFFPGQGDSGDFEVRLIKQEQGGILQRPYKYFNDTLELLIISYPSTGFSFSEIDQGPFIIGDVSGLMFPQDGIKPKTEYNISTGISSGGSPYSVDGPKSGDFYESEFEMTCNTYKMYQLTEYLLSNRSGDITITTPSGYYLFGSDSGSSGIYTCKFLGSEHSDNEIIFRVRHDGFDQWKTTITFWMREQTA
jgi:hypothetical protein